jgi:Transcription initiation factor IID, 18kD subunit
MMFVSGEVAEPLSETTGLVEDIVRAQVVEMVRFFLFSIMLTGDRPSNCTGGSPVIKIHLGR